MHLAQTGAGAPPPQLPTAASPPTAGARVTSQIQTSPPWLDKTSQLDRKPTALPWTTPPIPARPPGPVRPGSSHAPCASSQHGEALPLCCLLERFLRLSYPTVPSSVSPLISSRDSSQRAAKGCPCGRAGCRRRRRSPGLQEGLPITVKQVRKRGSRSARTQTPPSLSTHPLPGVPGGTHPGGAGHPQMRPALTPPAPMGHRL